MLMHMLISSFKQVRPFSSTVKSLRPLLSRTASTQSLLGKDIRNVLWLGKREKWRLLGAIAFLSISSVVTLSVPWLVGRMIDALPLGTDTKPVVSSTKLNSNDSANIWFNFDKFKHSSGLSVSFLICLFMLGGFSNAMRIYFLRTSGERILKRLRGNLFSHILSHPVSFFDRKHSGELTARLMQDTLGVGDIYSSVLSDCLRSSFQLLAAASMMMWISPQLTLASLAAVPILVGSVSVLGRRMKAVAMDMQDKSAACSQFAEERFQNARIVKAFNQSEGEKSNFSSKLSELLETSFAYAQWRAIFYGLAGFSGNIIMLSVLSYGGMMISQGEISVGALSSFVLYAGFAGISMTGLGSCYSDFTKSLGAASRVWELCDFNEDKTSVYSKHLELNEIHKKLDTDDIIFKDVSFSYGDNARFPALSNFSARFPCKQLSAIVGSSGCGKSTLAALLLQFYDDYAGSILIGDQDIKNFSKEDWHSTVRYVPQDPILFSGTIRENIAYGLSEEKGHHDCNGVILKAVEEANAVEVIKSFSTGLDTFVGEGGKLLSGGQRQRIAIARALIGNPKVLILDEATSSLDVQSEELVRQSIVKLKGSRTIIIITHKRSMLRDVDNVLFMKSPSAQKSQSLSFKSDDIATKTADGIVREETKKG